MVLINTKVLIYRLFRDSKYDMHPCSLPAGYRKNQNEDTQSSEESLRR